MTGPQIGTGIVISNLITEWSITITVQNNNNNNFTFLKNTQINV